VRPSLTERNASDKLKCVVGARAAILLVFSAACDLLTARAGAAGFRVHGPRVSTAVMRIKITGDESISRQACTYAEYRLFSALSEVLDTGRVRNASLVLRRTKSRGQGDRVMCTVTVELDGGEVTRLSTVGGHPYAAINRAVERFRRHSRPERHKPGRKTMVATE